MIEVATFFLSLLRPVNQLEGVHKEHRFRFIHTHQAAKVLSVIGDGDAD